jgi:hypothetical protein
MKSFKRMFGCLCLCVLLSGVALSQITITAADVSSQLALGKTLTNWEDTLTKSVDVGSLGSSSWDFSGLKGHSGTALKSVLVPSAAPFTGAFPGATNALETDTTYQGQKGKVYLYLKLGTDLLNPGVMGANTAGNLILKGENSPADVTYKLPSTLGTAWSSVYTETVTISIILFPGTPPSVISQTATNHNVSYVVDAYGPMKMPGGAIYDALRIKKQDRRSSGTIAGYIFLARNGASVQVNTVDTLPPPSGVVALNKVQWSGPTLPLAVRVDQNVPAEYILSQNYPNPFNPTTTIRFGLPERSTVTVKVFNLLGEEVATVVDGIYDAGERAVEFDAANLASGVYVYRLQAGTFTQTRKMVVMR